MPIIGVDASRALRARRTGTERYALEILRHLLALPTATEYHWRLYVDAPLPTPDFFALSTPAGNSNLGALTKDVIHLPQRRLWTHRALGSAIHAHPPDLLFVPAHVIPFGLTYLRTLLRPSSGNRYGQGTAKQPHTVVTIHDLGYHWFPAAHSWFQRIYLPISTRWNAAVATHVITPSTFTAVDLQQRYGTPPHKISVIYEAPSAIGEQSTTRPDRVTPDMVAQIKARHGLPQRYALYVGTLQPRKNLHRLLNAYAKLVHTQEIDWHLVLAGAAGQQSAALHALAHALGVAERVHCLGYVSDAALAALYCGAHLFTFPSLFEGFGLPVLEAQSYGVPVMSANNSSLPEIAGDAALLVDPTDVDAIADAMLQLSKDEALRQQLIERGYANTRRFSWEKAARETLAVFEKVLGRSE
ncbi:MAG: glycosyltransferase family 4 protein [Caldilineaceae bacterium]|nr:glycosyltransferase family 4 protein [Caldilineaceae bacterium]